MIDEDEYPFPAGFSVSNDDFDEFDHSDVESDICCYCGDPDTDSTALEDEEGPRKKFKSNKCHVSCEDDLL